MRIKFIEKWRFKLMGRAVPVMKCEDVDFAGRVTTLHYLGNVKKRPNSLVSTWDNKGWEIDPEYGPIRYIDERGLESYIYVVSEAGKTCPLHTRMTAFPNLEDVIGKGATCDDIGEAMDYKPSMSSKFLFLIVGLGIGAVFLGPMLQAVLS